MLYWKGRDNIWKIRILFISQKATNKTGSTNLNPIEKQEDLSTLIDEIYKGKEDVLPKLQTQFIEPTDTESVKGATGLDNGNDLQYIAISEPMMSSQAYSLSKGKRWSWC